MTLTVRNVLTSHPNRCRSLKSHQSHLPSFQSVQQPLEPDFFNLTKEAAGCCETPVQRQPSLILGWVHTCNVTAYRSTVSWQCGRDSCPRNVSKVGYAVTLRACSVCCRYLAVALWYGYGLSRCGRATWRCTSTPAQAVNVSSHWCDGQIPTAHRTSP